MEIIEGLDLIGTYVFAISGATTASEKKMDLFGGVIMGFITAVGGGTLRDLLLDAHPLGWMNNPLYLWIIAGGVATAFLFKHYISHLRNTLFLFDTIGIAVFTILGLQKSLSYEFAPVIAVILGMVSAVMGGVIRDTLCNEVPLIFRKEIYATICLFGGGLYLVLAQLGMASVYCTWLSIAAMIVVRLLVVKYNWRLPEV